VENYRRDDLWEAATWADIDQVVLDEVRNVSVARRVFPTEDLSTARGGAPSWISTAKARHRDKALSLPEGSAQPFVEISVGFRLTRAQVEAEDTLHTARNLARLAAKSLALAEDHIVLCGAKGKLPRRTIATNVGGRTGVALTGGRKKLPKGVKPKELLDKITEAISRLERNGWSEPYALILSGGLGVKLHSRLRGRSEETPERRLADRVRQHLVSGSLRNPSGVLISLAGDPVTIYEAQGASTSFVAKVAKESGYFYTFNVSERFQFVVRDDSAIVRLER
jgi:uncharacterized linocin/CFP29 family protein